MKKTIFTLGILAITLGFANAQGQVSKSTFTAETSMLNLSISTKNISGQNNAFNQLIGMMNMQMNWLTGYIGTLQTNYAADTAKAHNQVLAADKEKAIAAANLLAAQSLLSKGTSSSAAMDSVQYAQVAVTRANNDLISATSNMTAARNEISVINKNNTYVATERKMYITLQQFKNNIAASKNTIDNDLNIFAATLQ
jgi:hypothetical protein